MELEYSRECWKLFQKVTYQRAEPYFLSKLFSADHAQYQADQRKWKRLSVTLLVVSVITHCGWEVLEWRNFMLGTGKTSLFDHDVLSPLPWDLAMWQYMVLWTMCSTIPFLFTQVIFSVVLIFGRFLGSCLGRIVCSVELLDKVILEHSSMEDRKRANVVAEEVTRLYRLHYQAAQFGHLLSDLYGVILFFIYGLDVMTILGFVATVIVGTVKTVIGRCMLAYSIMAFGMYATLFLIPLVQVHEQVRR